MITMTSDVATEEEGKKERKKGTSKMIREKEAAKEEKGGKRGRKIPNRARRISRYLHAGIGHFVIQKWQFVHISEGIK